ncbi:YncE family protein [Streptomyces sp. MMG1533]|nr:hypothetical protein [Streptomyces sp. MMG1533]
MAVVDTATGKLVGAPIPTGKAPHGVTLAPDGRHAHVTNTGSDTLSVVDL